MTMSSAYLPSVIVAGAGITGLRTAQLLHAGGLSVTVLEARDRLGGRLLSVPAAVSATAAQGWNSADAATSGMALDLGATWFWPNESRVAALVRELGLPVHEQYLAGDALYEDPGGVQRLRGNPLDAPAGRFTSGAAALPKALAHRLPHGVVRSRFQVEEVHVAVGGVKIRGATGGGPSEELLADHVVLALPPSLAVHGIRFTPPLPPPVAALASATPVWMGATTKVVVQYADPFWRGAGLAGSAVSHVGPMREIHDLSGPAGEPAALFGFCSSSAEVGGAVAEEAVIAQMARLFGADAGRPLAVHIMDWRHEEWTSPPGVERNQNYQLFGHPALQDPIHDRVHLASTETAPAFGGHIEGALLAAELVVDRILARS